MWTAISDFFTDHVDWFVTKPIRIVLILLAAFIVSRLVRRAARRVAQKLADRSIARDEAQRAATASCEAADEDSALSRGLDMVRETLVSAIPVSERASRAALRTKTLAHVLSSIASIVIWVVAIMLCLSELDVNLAPLLAGAGIAGIAVGFGAQSLVKDFLSGVFILTEDQYGVGDIVDVGDTTGVVEEVSLRITRLRSMDGTLWHVPNGEIRKAGNKSQYWARIVLDLPVPYDADIAEATELIKRVAVEAWRSGGCENIVEEPEVWGVEEFGPDSISVRLVVKTRPGSQWSVGRDMRARIKKAFDQAGLEIPFPQRTVWIRTQPAPDAELGQRN